MLSPPLSTLSLSLSLSPWDNWNEELKIDQVNILHFLIARDTFGDSIDLALTVLVGILLTVMLREMGEGKNEEEKDKRERERERERNQERKMQREENGKGEEERKKIPSPTIVHNALFWFLWLRNVSVCLFSCHPLSRLPRRRARCNSNYRSKRLLLFKRNSFCFKCHVMAQWIWLFVIIPQNKNMLCSFIEETRFATFHNCWCTVILNEWCFILSKRLE